MSLIVDEDNIGTKNVANLCNDVLKGLGIGLKYGQLLMIHLCALH